MRDIVLVVLLSKSELLVALRGLRFGDGLLGTFSVLELGVQDPARVEVI